ncbi:hypothetical protein MNBD_GAMMA22-1101 [hydrothermal vent metagenome]|uniref:Uncharacterized protein n=1 Tax=hydrothermal vent metagenome TaxID=652676 RepID=A0A3B1AP73_9ZZZZ
MKFNLTKITGVTLLGAAIATPSFAADVAINGFVRTGYDVTKSLLVKNDFLWQGGASQRTRQ